MYTVFLNTPPYDPSTLSMFRVKEDSPRIESGCILVRREDIFAPDGPIIRELLKVTMGDVMLRIPMSSVIAIVEPLKTA